MNEEIKKYLMRLSDITDFSSFIRYIIDNDITSIQKIETENKLEIYFKSTNSNFIRIYKIENQHVRIMDKAIL